MGKALKIILIALLATLSGIVSYYFVQGWYNVIPWAIAALVIGYTSKSRRNSMINGAIFGYFLFLMYILLGYNGKTDASSLIGFGLFDLFFSLVGSIAGVAGAYIGNLLKSIINKADH